MAYMTRPFGWAGRGTGSAEHEEEEWTGCRNGEKALQAEDSTYERPGLSSVEPAGGGEEWGTGREWGNSNER